MTDPRCRRLLFISTSVWSGASPRRLIGLCRAAKSLEGLALTWKEGTTERIRFDMSLPLCRANASPSITSMGTGASRTERGAERVPTTTTVSICRGSEAPPPDSAAACS